MTSAINKGSLMRYVFRIYIILYEKITLDMIWRVVEAYHLRFCIY